MDIKNLNEVNRLAQELKELRGFITNFSHYNSKISYKKLITKPYGFYSGDELDLNKIEKESIVKALKESQCSMEEKLERLLNEKA